MAGHPENRKYHRLTEQDRITAIVSHQKGVSAHQIAKQIGCSHKAVLHTLQRYTEHGTVQDLPRSGRPRKVGANAIALLERAIHRPRRRQINTSRDATKWLAQHQGLVAAPLTVRRAMREVNLYPYIVQRKPISTPSSRAARGEFAHRWEALSRKKLKRWIFTDEASVARAWSGQMYAWRKRGSRLFEGRTLSVPANESIKVNLWAAISHTGFLCFHVYEERMAGALYCKIMEEVLLPAIQERFGVTGHSRMVQDNATFHKANVVSALFATQAWKNVDVLDFPAYSPDLNLIENAWTHLASVVDDLEPRTKVELVIAIHVAIDHINSEESKTHYFRNLFASFPERCKAVIREQGRPTEY